MEQRFPSIAEMMLAEDVLHVYNLMFDNGMPVWLTGGWGIDALLGVQTRPHKDMDIFMRLEDVQAMQELLSHEGYSMKEIWSENQWQYDANRAAIPTAFVLSDKAGREIDVHAIRLDEQGDGLPAWVTDVGFVLTRQDLADKGQIAGWPVRCITA